MAKLKKIFKILFFANLSMILFDIIVIATRETGDDGTIFLFWHILIGNIFFALFLLIIYGGIYALSKG